MSEAEGVNEGNAQNSIGDVSVQQSQGNDAARSGAVERGTGSGSSSGDKREEKVIKNETVAETMARASKQIALVKGEKSVNQHSEKTEGEDSSGKKEALNSTPDNSKSDDGNSEERSSKEVGQELRAPQQWRPEARESWQKLPRHVQEEVIKRERELLTAANQHAERARNLQQQLETSRQSVSVDEEIDAHIKQWYPDADIAQVTRNYLEFDHLVRNSPFHAVQLIAKIHGVDPGKFVDGYDEWVDGRGYEKDVPKLFKPKAELPKEVLEVIEELKQFKEEAKESASAATRASKQAEVDAFAKERDENGDEKRPFFYDIEKQIVHRMKILVEEGEPVDFSTLQKAYELEVWANPETRRKLMAREQQKQINEKKKKAEASSRSERSLRSSVPTGGPSEKVNLRESVAETIQRAQRLLAAKG